MALADDIATLKAAIRRGVMEVEYDGQRVRYQSAKDMKATLRSMEMEAGTITADNLTVYPEFGKGV